MERRNDLPSPWAPTSPENSLRVELNTVVKKMDIMTESHHKIFQILWHLGEENRKYMEEAKSRDNSMRRAMADIQRDLRSSFGGWDTRWTRAQPDCEEKRR